MYTLAPENQDTYQLTARPWGGVCAVPQFINSFDEDDARLEDNYIQGQQYTYSGEILKRSIDGKPLIYTVELAVVTICGCIDDESGVIDAFGQIGSRCFGDSGT